MLTRKDKLLLYCLGRETTPYKAAEKWDKRKGTEINMGPWYACKVQLLKEKMIVEAEEKGREKPVKANVTKYLGNLFEDNKVSTQIQILLPEDLTEKYSKRIVDIAFERHPQVLEWESSLYLPIYVLLFARLVNTPSPKYDSPWPALSAFLASVQRYAHAHWGVTIFPVNEVFNTLSSFLGTLTDSERTELSIPTRDTQEGKQIAEALDVAILLQLLPANLLKGMMIEMVRFQKRHEERKSAIGTHALYLDTFIQFNRLILWVFMPDHSSRSKIESKVKQRLEKMLTTTNDLDQNERAQLISDCWGSIATFWWCGELNPYGKCDVTRKTCPVWPNPNKTYLPKISPLKCCYIQESLEDFLKGKRDLDYEQRLNEGKSSSILDFIP